MVSSPSFDKIGMNKRAWTQEEDKKLVDYVTRYGHWNWSLLPKFSGLARSGKSCRFRWMNYLRPNIKRGNYTEEEEETVIKLHQLLGNRWSAIASQMPGRTDNEIKNYWNSYLKKRLQHSSVTKPKISKSKDHLKDKQIKLKKQFQYELVSEAQNTRSKDHSPVVEPIVNNLTGPSQSHHTTQMDGSCPFPQHSSTSGPSSISSEYSTVANNQNMNLDDEFAFLDVDTYPMSGNFLLHMPIISYVPGEFECLSPVNLVTEAQVSKSKDHSPVVEPIVNNIIGPFQSQNSTQLANSCPFSQYSSLTESSSTNTKYTTAANNEYMDSEDEFAFLDTDTYPMSGNFRLEPYNMIDISYVPSELEYFSQVKSVTKYHSLVELATDDTIGPFHSHHSIQLANSCPFRYHSSLSESSSTSATYTTVANYENMGLENEFAFPDADKNHMGGNFLLEQCMLEISHIPSALNNFSLVNSVTEAQVSNSFVEPTTNNIIDPFHSHYTTQLSDSCLFSQHSSSSTSTKYALIVNNENMDLEDEFAFLDAGTYSLFENFLLEPYMLDNSHVPNEPQCFSSVNSVTEEVQVSKSKDHSANMEPTPNNIIVGPFQSHHTIQFADSLESLDHSSLRESLSSSTDANFTTVTNNENIVLVEDELAFLDSDICSMY